MRIQQQVEKEKREQMLLEKERQEQQAQIQAKQVYLSHRVKIQQEQHKNELQKKKAIHSASLSRLSATKKFELEQLILDHQKK